MKLNIYGTAAAEGVPGLFCDCDVCRRSRELGGRNLRSRTQALVSDELLIDFPPDTMYHALHFGLPVYKIKYLIITHKHADHLLAHDLLQRKKTYAYPDDMEPINIYGSQPSIDAVASELQKNDVLKQGRWILNELSPFVPTKIGGMTVTPYKGNHDFRTNPFMYDITDGKKRMLYGHDTGLFLDETWDYIKKTLPHFDLISLDCTCGIKPDCGCHMNEEQCIITAEKFRKLGCADDKTIFLLHHFSHNGGATYDDLVPIAKKHGFEVSYDGMEINF